MKKQVIAISGINATDNPGPGVPVARSLKEANPEIFTVGLSYDLHDPGNYMDFVFDATFRLPYPTQGWEALKRKLLDIKARCGLDVVIPCLDAELPLFVGHQEELLRDFGIKSFLPTNQQFNLRAKDHLVALCNDIGCRHPETKVVNSLNSLQESLKDTNYPVVVKGNYYMAKFAFTPDDACHSAIEIANDWGWPILLQKPVSGVELNVVGLGDGQGGSLGHMAIKKLKTTKLGKIWNGITIKSAALEALTERFLEATKWRGPYELECMVSQAALGEEIYLIEVNPRFPAWVYFATGCQLNLPQRLIDFVNTGNCEASCEYEAGRYFVRYCFELVTDLEKLQELSVEDW